jgi:hypothetical protein
VVAAAQLAGEDDDVRTLALRLLSDSQSRLDGIAVCDGREEFELLTSMQGAWRQWHMFHEASKRQRPERERRHVPLP